MGYDGPPPPIKPLRGGLYKKPNNVYGKPDYSYWGRLRVWGSWQAALLLSDVEPRNNVNFSDFDEPPNDFFQSCKALHELLVEGDIKILVTFGGGSFEAKNVDYLAWARRMKFDIPLELEAAVMEFYGQNVVNWQAKYEGEVPLLESRITQLENENKKPNTKELKSLQKLAITLAIEFAKYNPRNIPANLISEIEQASKSFGVALSDETIRNKLKLAAEMVNKATKEEFEKKGKV